MYGAILQCYPYYWGKDVATIIARIFTVTYFLFFILMPFYSKKILQNVPTECNEKYNNHF